MNRFLSRAGDLIGWVGVTIGVCVNLPQAWTIYTRQTCADVAPLTYWLLLACVTCYFLHALKIRAWVFVVSNGLAIVVTSTVLLLIARYS